MQNRERILEGILQLEGIQRILEGKPQYNEGNYNQKNTRNYLTTNTKVENLTHT